MEKLWCIALSIALIFICVPSQSQSFLKTDGQQIVTEEGENFIFRGMGLGGWMLQEGYMLKTAGFANAQFQIRNTIQELIGEEATSDFYEAWLENHVTRADVEALAEWGFNSVRLPMHYNLYTLPIEEEPIIGENTWLTKGFELTDSLISWCRDNNMYIILDLHAAPGGQGRDQGISDYDPSKPSLWESEDNRNKTVAFWKKVAETYADEPVIGAYDLINETNWEMDGNIPLRDLYHEITDSIRAVDTMHIIFIEGNWFANDFTNLTPPWDDNLVYSPHKYWSINDQASIQWALDIRDQHNVPIMFGECGENSNVWFTDAITLFEERNIGWAWWPMKKVDDIAGPLSVERTDGYQQLLDYWEGGGSAPDPSFAASVLMKLADDFKIENCTYQKDVIDAMFRQVENDEPAPFRTFDIPGVIFATDFDLGGLNVAYYDTDNANYQVSTGNFTAWNNGWTYRNDAVDIEQSSDNVNSNGLNVGWLADEEWMQYDINVTESAVYNVKVRLATESNDGAFHLQAGQASLSGSISVPNTNGWQNWESLQVSNVILSEADKKLRLYIDNQTFNVSSLELEKVAESTSINTDFLSAITIDEQNIQLNINKALDLESTADLSGFSIFVNSSSVNITKASVDENNTRILYFEVDDEFRSDDVIEISYAGSDILAFDGTILSTFNLEDVQNTVAIIHGIPGRVEMEDYFFQSGVQLENTTDDGGGQNIGFLDNGDYLDYYINVSQSGTYKVDFRTAAQSEMGAIKMQLIETNNEVTTLFDQVFPSTGGWQTWTTTSGPEVFLPSGQHQIRVTITQPLFNINWMEFSLLSSTLDENEVSFLEVHPNPSADIFRFLIPDSFRGITEVVVTDMGGRLEGRYRLENIELWSLNLSEAPAGQYVVHFSNKDSKSNTSMKVLKY